MTRADYHDPSDADPFLERYRLAPGQVLRRIVPPFLDQRFDFYRRKNPSQAEAIPRGPDAMTLHYRAGELKNFGCFFGAHADGGRGYAIYNLLEQYLRTYPQDLEGDAELAKKTIPGDFISDPDATTDQLHPVLEEIISQAVGFPVRFSLRNVPRPVIVFTGTWCENFVRSLSAHMTRSRLEIYGDQLGEPNRGGGGTDDIPAFANSLGSWIRRSVIIESENAPQKLSWHYNYPRDPENFENAQDYKIVCPRIAEQTGLAWREETRVIERLFIERASLADC